METVRRTNDRLRVVLADDHEGTLAAIRYLLLPDFDVVHSAGTGAALVQAALELRPDVVISDIRMPGLNGIDAGRKILEQNVCRSVVMLTTYNDPELVSQALKAGILGYVLKTDAGEELIPAVHNVVAGSQYLSRGVL